MNPSLYKTPVDLTTTVFEPWTVVSSMCVEPMYITYRHEIRNVFNLGVVCFVPGDRLKKPILTDALDKHTKVTNMMASQSSTWLLMTAPSDWTDLQVCKRLRARPECNSDRELLDLNSSYGVVTWHVRVNQVFDSAITFLRLEDKILGDIYGNV